MANRKRKIGQCVHFRCGPPGLPTSIDRNSFSLLVAPIPQRTSQLCMALRVLCPTRIFLHHCTYGSFRCDYAMAEQSMTERSTDKRDTTSEHPNVYFFEARTSPVDAFSTGRTRLCASKIGVPAEEQAKAYIAMLSATASLKGDVAAGSIFDFSLAAEAARELAQKK